MSADQFIAVRVSSETKSRFHELAERRHTSESKLLKQCIELMLQASDPLPANAVVLPDTEPAQATRLSIRLRPEDLMLLRERAAARQVPSATYVSVLVRSHLRSLAPLPKEELLAVKRAVAELGFIGRNLNQLARVANQGGTVPMPGSREALAMLRVSEALRDHVKALLAANTRSWNQGHAGADE